MSESWFYHISQKGKLSSVATVDAALAAAKDGGFLWLDYCQPTKEELSNLIDPLGLHPLSIEDCLDENQIPKIEDFPQNTFIIFNTFDYSNKKLSDRRDRSVYRRQLSGYRQPTQFRKSPAFGWH